jgi:hypothetical protein
LHDPEGKEANNVLHDGLHPALRALGLPQDRLPRFPSRLQPKVGIVRVKSSCHSQQMGHSSATMTALYTGQIPLEEVRAAFSRVELENEAFT